MVGVDRGNRPPKGGTNCCQSAKRRRRPVIPYGRRRHAGTPAVCITLAAEADHSVTHYTCRLAAYERVAGLTALICTTADV